MKQILLTTILISVLIFQLETQVEDSSRLNFPILRGMTLSDSSAFDKNKKINPYSLFLIDGHEPLLIGKKKEMVLGFKFSQNERSFFSSSYSKLIIPTTLISYGIIARGNHSLLNLDQSTNNEIVEHLSRHIPYDDYSQYVPTMAIYGLDLLGIKAKHNFRDRTLVVATSYLIMGATVQTMKSSFGIERPDGSNFHSFPSGHTATAFVGAHILFKEYKGVSSWIGIGGYAVATATGTMRVFNKKHWVSDVVAGAGIGILSAELGYLLLPVWHNLLGIKNKENIVVVPSVGFDSAGIGLAYTF